jgi:hypothetical protein
MKIYLYLDLKHQNDRKERERRMEVPLCTFCGVQLQIQGLNYCLTNLLIFRAKPLPNKMERGSLWRRRG